MNKQLIAVVVIILGVIVTVFWLKNKPKDELYTVMKVPDFDLFQSLIILGSQMPFLKLFFEKYMDFL